MSCLVNATSILLSCLVHLIAPEREATYHRSKEVCVTSVQGSRRAPKEDKLDKHSDGTHGSRSVSGSGQKGRVVSVVPLVLCVQILVPGPSPLVMRHDVVDAIMIRNNRYISRSYTAFCKLCRVAQVLLLCVVSRPCCSRCRRCSAPSAVSEASAQSTVHA